ncbi:LytR/AlgR family response regulator transcription factor [Flavobacterium sp. N1719]|uniref:LytR/AlgR family response regulator transcription factor n=1 Tax=Flavobacterium sp. N1719 TaxID=2885633 RepID=UPI0022235126|nr:LytTR family DNA-binding domain-containing protein [Flavobacterium sp. N1719]
MKCIIVDDEPLAVDLLVDFCGKMDALTLVKTFNNAIDAISFVNQNKIDLIFLDIEMPQFTGMDFINTLESKPMIIFTTAYSNYAVEGFDNGALDYLLKPIPFSRFVKAVLRAEQQFKLVQNNPSAQTEAPLLVQEEEANFMFIKVGYETMKIDFKDILFIEGLKDYVKIIFTNNTNVLSLMSMSKLETTLENKGFCRIHRSYIVNLKSIQSIQRNRILIADKRLPVSDTYRESFFKTIQLKQR